MLIDQAQIHIKAGDGGSGIISFRREKFVPKGGPDGGDGGKGGDVYLKVDPSLNTLLEFRYRRHFKAQKGAHGSGANKTGKSGDDLYIPVPPGTVVKDLNGNVVADLVEPDQVWPAARGGRGGRGNARFATPTNRAPRKFDPGGDGEETDLMLELKLLADVGLVGLPNAGKSTLLSRLSNARPKIADYPFTTLEPHLGIVAAGEHRSFVMADLPGLIEGAHQGKGLGLRFLKHIERTRVLVMLIDITSTDPAGDVRVLENELREYDPALLKRPRLVMASKADLIDPDELSTFRYDLRISSVTGEGLPELIIRLWDMLREAS
jgi:GTP-binding protein